MKDDAAIQSFTDMVAGATAADVDARTRQIMDSLIRHLHHFVTDVSLTLEELVSACAFLVRAGQISNDARDEFLLMANILGLEVLIDMISPGGGEQTTILGPMYLAQAPELPNGASIVRSAGTGGETVLVEGHVRDADGRPIADATLDVWQADTNGLYDIQDPRQPAGNLRGVFRTDESGHYSFRCLRPTPYPIPDDGPGGRLLQLLKRHPMRPAHLHAIVKAPGKHTIVSQLYDADCTYIGSDSVFAVKGALVMRFVAADERAGTDLHVRYDWTLKDR
ncbi:dioxygenase family protein [Azospirillum doebereinerae]